MTFELLIYGEFADVGPQQWITEHSDYFTCLYKYLSMWLFSGLNCDSLCAGIFD
jgi:hypothetical protein